MYVDGSKPKITRPESEELDYEPVSERPTRKSSLFYRSLGFQKSIFFILILWAYFRYCVCCVIPHKLFIFWKIKKKISIRKYISYIKYINVLIHVVQTNINYVCTC